jgi:hypothetical protein
MLRSIEKVSFQSGILAIGHNFRKKVARKCLFAAILLHHPLAAFIYTKNPSPRKTIKRGRLIVLRHPLYWVI